MTAKNQPSSADSPVATAPAGPTVALATAALVVLKEQSLLLAFSNNKQAWYLPGGKIDAGENAQQALLREIEEELDLVLDTGRLQFLCHVSAPAYGEAPNVVMEQDCFLYDARDDRFIASQEIGDARYFSFAEYRQQPVQVPGVLTMFGILRERGLLA
ncbi:NUDIX hydrolase [Kerstersia gyiorum]|uniref:ADP-ribose pyrophosphatase YjhB (NUDIX family) n=1 Tax=Kerstersia gyiorum TaxID=206506 RepID=A0A4Q7MQN0_9BURK|nr:NUDIX domain-containing protein [Kerstersia gyiorum]MCO7636520.1 NUDIX domain-containing protein [Pseudomonas sp. S 311-6]KAB0543712.1 NUDIX domain-containing protein [Kerstersia gyiorum]MCP1634661.1 8-oxo-dGTP pyrophosphatase MutT (NUDIX family) [Kerstersia gyiorum]MCP1636981.1 8-oxo-dGTP pyrophosphatase MutT (NUDIX family) [Kerstersia gyiorum]MCP1670458.1 8-oxo-dGTP pyrophosphatase MutT (NUDIX family) [Kerstersia gyiorum]